MKNLRLVLCLFTLAALAPFFVVKAQFSPNTVSYSVVSENNSNWYTVWVHPNYGTPNNYNGRITEFVFTAQVSLKVPKEFSISNISDIRCTWEKNPRKVGDPYVEKALLNETYDSTARYYSIGMSPGCDVDNFTKGDSIPLFKFQGNEFADLDILPNNDPFIQIAWNTLSLNVACSFYSLSGQPRGESSIPLEQFADKKLRQSYSWKAVSGSEIHSNSSDGKN